MKKLTTVLFAFVATIVMVFAEAKPVVVIVPFDAKNVSKDDVDVISEVFLSEYTSTGKATVVDRGIFDKIKAQQKFETSDWSSSEKVARLGKALNANQIVTGQISQFGNQLVCTIKLVDVNTTEIISSTVKRVANMDALFTECTKLSRDIAAMAALSVSDYKIGSKGPGGGLVYAIEGDWRWEVSENLGAKAAYSCAKDYQANGFFDWFVPTNADLQLVYNNLVKTGTVSNSGVYETSDSYISFETGRVGAWTDNIDKKQVRLVRKFNINDTEPKAFEIVGKYTAEIPISKLNYEYNSAWTAMNICYKEIKKYMQKYADTISLMLEIKKDGTWSLSSIVYTMDVKMIVDNAKIGLRKHNFKRIDFIGKPIFKKIEYSGTWIYYPDKNKYWFGDSIEKYPFRLFQIEYIDSKITVHQISHAEKMTVCDDKGNYYYGMHNVKWCDRFIDDRFWADSIVLQK